MDKHIKQIIQKKCIKKKNGKHYDCEKKIQQGNALGIHLTSGVRRDFSEEGYLTWDQKDELHGLGKYVEDWSGAKSLDRWEFMEL